MIRTPACFLSLALLAAAPLAGQTATRLLDAHHTAFLGAAGGRMVFRSCENGVPVMRATGGTPETTAVLPFVEEGFSCSDYLPALTIGDRLFLIRASPGINSNRSLWRFDGTAAGTVRLFHLTAQSQSLRAPVEVQGQAWFLVHRGWPAASEVWRSDGTPQRTVKAFDAPEGIWQLKSTGTRLYFTTVPFPESLWSSDGTLAGSQKIYEGNLDLELPFAGAGAQAFFPAWDQFEPQLWRTDGTVAGTRPVASFPPLSASPRRLTFFDGLLYFFATDEAGEWQLWRSDGTAAGTFALGTFDVRRSEVSFTPFFELAGAAGRMFFAAGLPGGEHGVELWSTDGTVAGTRLVRDIFPGEETSAPSGFRAAGGHLYFAAGDGVHGVELWRSDGTEAGTRLIQDLAPQALSSHPQQLEATATHLYFTADDGATGRAPWALPLAGAGCQPSATRLCLGGGRFQVEALWRDFQGRSGAGQAVPLSADTGTFWFFSPENVETVVKVLDGRGVNEHVWVFYGALSNVEYTLTVTDTQTGLARRYFNPLGQFASVGDTHAFGRLGAFSRSGAQDAVHVAPPSPPARVSSRTDPSLITAACEPTPTRLCLRDNRFAVEVAWKDFQGNSGTGKAVPLTSDTGTFWFFDAANVELVLKVLDGTPVNGHHWVFYGALSNVEYTITVTDTQTGVVKTYQNPAGRFASVGDTEAF